MILDERRWGCCSHPGSLSLLFLLGTAGGLLLHFRALKRDWNVDFNLKGHGKVHPTNLMTASVSETLWTILGARLQMVSALWALRMVEVTHKWFQFMVGAYLRKERGVTLMIGFKAMRKSAGHIWGNEHSFQAALRVKRE